MTPGKCSRKNCPTQNIGTNVTANCYRCKCKIHLPCYDVRKSFEEIFVIANIVILCDLCLDTVDENEKSPKRKQPNGSNLIQRTIDTQNSTISLSMTSQLAPIKNSSKNQQQAQLQNATELMSRKLEENTVTISSLKSSVDSMKQIVLDQNTAVGDSIRINNENISNIKTTIAQTQGPIKSSNTPSYAATVKYGRTENLRSTTDTPTSSRSPLNKTTRVPTPKGLPLIVGTSTISIGKPLSPVQRHSRPTKSAEKAIWLSGLHRDTKE